MRVFGDSDVQSILNKFGREALIWRQLAHPNVLPFFGVYYLEARLCLVSPWMENGNIKKFLEINKPATGVRLSMVSISIGLQYLHKENIIHGDLKAVNILVTPLGRACIADFGASAITHTMTLLFTTSSANGRGGTARYQALELFQGGQNHFGSDVYAFACVCYEIMSGTIPFAELPNDMAVMFAVIEGKRPLRPMSCTGTTVLDSL
ncbi:kinase-like domain-containing protein [Mycena leptocephala]|nr:kinase-like domain-containing protein [Mycena leptocephala]